LSITYSLNIFAFDMQKIDFSNKPKLHKRRHIIKAITWRIVGTADTWIISWLLLNYISDIHFFNITLNDEIKSKSIQAATLIATLELISKTILYYFHERIWYRLNFISQRQRVRHMIKTISWRLVGAIDTIVLVFIVFYMLFSSIEGAASVALSMFSIEIITKMILYYMHERIWFSSNFGVIKNK
jgi:uncharacterized membrane protein